MSEIEHQPAHAVIKTPLRGWAPRFSLSEGQILLALSIVIGSLTGLAVVAFILATERLGMRLYPIGNAAWRRVLIPVLGPLGMGYLLYRYFPDARGSGVPQTKAALFARDGVITAGTTFGKFFCTSATLASGIPLGREGPSVQVGAGIASISWQTPGPAALPREGAHTGGGGRGNRRCFQYTSRRRLIRARGNRRRSQRTRSGLRRARLGNSVAGAPANARKQSPFPGSAIPTGPSDRICPLCGAGSDGRPGLGTIHQAPARHARALFAASVMDEVVSTRGGRFDGWTDGLVGASGSRRRLWLRRGCLERPNGSPIDGAADRVQTSSGNDKLRLRQCRRNFRSQFVYWGHARRNLGQRRASSASGLYGFARCLRARRHGHLIRRYCACAYDFGTHDFRNDA